QPGRPTQTLLEAANDCIDVPRLRRHLDATDAEHRVHQQQAADLSARVAYLRKRLQDARRRVRMHHRDQFRRSPTERPDQSIRLDAAAPLSIDPLNLCAMTTRQRAQQLTEMSVRAYQHTIARSDQACQCGFDARAGCARDCEPEALTRTKQLTQIRANFGQHSGVRRIVCWQRLRGHGAEYTRLRIAWARAHQKPLRRVKRGAANRNGGPEKPWQAGTERARTEPPGKLRQTPRTRAVPAGSEAKGVMYRR